VSSQPGSASESGLLTVAEYLALVETERGYDELIEGRCGLRCLLDLGPLPVRLDLDALR
jgi:hypothetical protein